MSCAIGRMDEGVRHTIRCVETEAEDAEARLAREPDIAYEHRCDSASMAMSNVAAAVVAAAAAVGFTRNTKEARGGASAIPLSTPNKGVLARQLALTTSALLATKEQLAQAQAALAEAEAQIAPGLWYS